MEASTQLHPFREARLKKGVSTIFVARKLGVSRAAVSSWETGRTRPSVEMAKKAVAAIGETDHTIFYK